MSGCTEEQELHDGIAIAAMKYLLGLKAHISRYLAFIVMVRRTAKKVHLLLCIRELAPKGLMCQAHVPQGMSIDIRFPDFGTKEKKMENMSCFIVQ